MNLYCSFTPETSGDSNSNLFYLQGFCWLHYTPSAPFEFSRGTSTSMRILLALLVAPRFKYEKRRQNFVSVPTTN